MPAAREYERAWAPSDGAVFVDITAAAGGDLVATVTWGDWISDGVTRHGETIGPMPVPEALSRATQAAALYELDRITVGIPDDALWSVRWGTLLPFSMEAADLDDDPLEADDGDEGRAPLVEWADDDEGSDAAHR